MEDKKECHLSFSKIAVGGCAESEYVETVFFSVLIGKKRHEEIIE